MRSRRTVRWVGGRLVLLVLALFAGRTSAARAGDCTISEVGRIEPMACPAPPGARYPRLGRGPDGRSTVLSWTEARTGGRHALRYALLEDGHWSAPRTVVESESLFVNWADFPIVTAVNLRLMVATWLVRVGEEPYAYHVRASVDTTDGTHWSAPVTVHADRSATEHGFVSLAGAGLDARIVWLDGYRYAGREPGDTLAAMTLHSAILGRDGVVRDEVEIDERTCDCCNTAIVLSGGGALIAYRDRDEAELRDIAYASVGLHGGPRREAGGLDGWKIPACPVNGPALSAELLGGGVGAVWYTEAGDRPQVRFAPARWIGDSLRMAASVAISESRPLGRVGIATAGNCEHIVSWMEERGDSADVMVRIARMDGSLGPQVRLGTTSARRDSGFPQLIASDLGLGYGCLAAWTEPGRKPRIRLAKLSIRQAR